MTLDEVARGYVELALGIGEHDPNYVDAYYGPDETRETVKAAKADLQSLARRGGDLVAAAEAAPRTDAVDAELLALRHDYLRRQLASAAARIEMLRAGR
jgi:hypothetical protein